MIPIRVFYEEVLVHTAVSIHRSTDTAASSRPENEKSLYERLGGVFAIATVVDHFGNAVLDRWVMTSALAAPRQILRAPTALRAAKTHMILLGK